MRIEVNGNYEVGEGKLLDILLDLGFDVPHLCYHKAIGSYGLAGCVWWRSKKMNGE